MTAVILPHRVIVAANTFVDMAHDNASRDIARMFQVVTHLRHRRQRPRPTCRRRLGRRRTGLR